MLKWLRGLPNALQKPTEQVKEGTTTSTSTNASTTIRAAEIAKEGHTIKYGNVPAAQKLAAIIDGLPILSSIASIASVYFSLLFTAQFIAARFQLPEPNTACKIFALVILGGMEYYKHNTLKAFLFEQFNQAPQHTAKAVNGFLSVVLVGCSVWLCVEGAELEHKSNNTTLADYDGKIVSTYSSATDSIKAKYSALIEQTSTMYDAQINAANTQVLKYTKILENGTKSPNGTGIQIDHASKRLEKATTAKDKKIATLEAARDKALKAASIAKVEGETAAIRTDMETDFREGEQTNFYLSVVIESSIVLCLFFAYLLKTISADDAAVDNETHATLTAQQMLSQLQFLQQVQAVGAANVLHVGTGGNVQTVPVNESAPIGHTFKTKAEKIQAAVNFCKETGTVNSSYIAKEYNLQIKDAHAAVKAAKDA